MTDPPLTTVHQPSYELGATAYELLRGTGEPEQRLFSPHLVQRESTGRACPPSARRSRRACAGRGRPRRGRARCRTSPRAGDEHDRAPRGGGGSSAATSSGTVSTIWSARTTQTWRSGTSVSARRPCPGPPSSAIVPVSAHAAAQVVSTPSSASSCRGERPSSSTSSTPGGRSRSSRSGGIPTRRAPCAAEHLGRSARWVGGQLDGRSVVGDALGERSTTPRAASSPRRRRSRAPAPAPSGDGAAPARASRHARSRSPTTRGTSAAAAPAARGSGPRRAAARREPADPAVAHERPLEAARQPLRALVAGAGAKRRVRAAAGSPPSSPSRFAAHDLPALVHEDRGMSIFTGQTS